MKVLLLMTMFIIISPLTRLMSYEQNINTINYVNFHKERWKNENDLSFKYSISVTNDILFVKVDVKDDKVILKKDSSINSDHVEIWLFDPACNNLKNSNIIYLTELISKRNQYGDTIKKPASDKEKKIYESDRKMDEYFISAAENQIKRNKALDLSIQLVFNDKTVLSFPTNGAAKNIRCNYQITKTGYIFLARIPLSYMFPVKTPVISRFGYLISVSDIDKTNAAKQEKMISSIENPIYRKLDTYNTYDMSYSFPIKIDNFNMMLHVIDSNGVFMPEHNMVHYYEKERIPWSGNYGIDRWILPGTFQKPAYFMLDAAFGKIYLYDNNILIEKNNNVVRIDLSAGIPVSKNAGFELLDLSEKNGIKYLFFKIQNYSRWPGGATMCGADEARENYIVLISIDKNDQVAMLDSCLIGSCFNSIVFEMVVTNNKYIFLLKNYSKNNSSEVTYDAANPEQAFAKVLKPIK